MAIKTHTTETLRQTLFDTIDKVLAKEVTVSEASQISTLAQTILKTADLELKYTLTLDKLDGKGSALNTGPMLLTQGE